MSELNSLLQRLSDAGIEFVVVGGVAAVLHGSSIATSGTSFLENPAPGVSVQNLYLQTDLGALDLLGSITGVGDFEQVRATAVEVSLFGRTVKVIGLDALIKAKESVGRQKDLLAAMELRAIASREC